MGDLTNARAELEERRTDLAEAERVKRDAIEALETAQAEATRKPSKSALRAIAVARGEAETATDAVGVHTTRVGIAAAEVARIERAEIQATYERLVASTTDGELVNALRPEIARLVSLEAEIHDVTARVDVMLTAHGEMQHAATTAAAKLGRPHAVPAPRLRDFVVGLVGAALADSGRPDVSEWIRPWAPHWTAADRHVADRARALLGIGKAS